MADLVCWKCGTSLADYTLPLRRLEECRKCGAELHVCKLCEWYDIAVAKHCREPIAEEVKDKEHANFCDYFKPRPGAYSDAGIAAATQAKSQLDALFGGSTSSAGPASPSPGPESAPAAAADVPSAADRARAELEALFGRGK
jgi:hypothetical protein